MTRLRALKHPTVVVVALTAVAIAALGVAAWFLADTQSQQRRDLRDRYVQRTAVAASLIDALFRVAVSGQAQQASERLSGARIPRAQLDAAVKRGNLAYTMVVDPTGRALAASSGAPRAADPTVVRQAVRHAGQLGLSSVRPGRPPVIESGVAFRTPAGKTRVQINGTPLAIYLQFLGSTLMPLPTLPGSRAFVLDRNGRSLGGAVQGGARVRPSPELVRATTGKMSGTYTVNGAKVFVATTPIPHTPWRIALAASDRRLYASVSGLKRWAPWAILMVGALALVAVAVLLNRLLATNRTLDANRRELELRALELERSNADLEQFAYAASHDLSEPLRTIAGFSQLLRSRYSGQLDAEADEFIGHMTAGVSRMQQLIDDLLVYSRVGRVPLHEEAVDLEEVVAEVLDWIAPTVSERGAHVTHDPLPTVRGERGQLAQVMQNLLSNAVKFTDRDTVPEVHVSAQRQGGDWRIAIRDNGIGVGGDAEHIFKMFSRLHPVDAYPGTGIGLALAKRIVEAHGGMIRVEPAPDGGSVFSFTVPAAAAARRPAVEEMTAR